MVNTILIIAGLVSMAVAIRGKTFYDADVEGMPLRNEREISPLTGKLVFGLVGIGLFIIGLVKLFQHE
jgi:hypothetical protein